MDRVRREAIVNLVVNVAAPIAVFYLMRAIGVGQWWSLLGAGALPAANALRTVVTRRRIDVLAVFTMSILVASVAVSFVTGSPRFLLAKDGWLTGVAGAWLLGTLVRTPFLYQVIRSWLTGSAREKAETAWRDSPTYRRMLRVTTSFWGVGLVLDAGVRVLLAYTLPVDRVPLIGGLQYVVLYLALEVATRLYGRRRTTLDRIEMESGQRLGQRTEVSTSV
jgi:hypothetical protein